MDKGQVKPKKDKKKNTQTGMLMGQNTNVFSQLSATYIQNKTQFSEEEAKFVSSTQIIEYHDPNINRIIALLRKKADVTKTKAAFELKEEIMKMEQQTLQQFMPTFAQLFLETVVNEQSKQVVDEFVLILNHVISTNKKVLIKEIATIYGPYLVSNRLNGISFIKGLGALFSGTDEQLQEKALILLMKKEVQKKFIIFCKFILECEQIHKIGQQNYQRNCSALMKVLKDFLRSFDALNSKNEQIQKGFPLYILEIDETLHHKTIQQYFKIGGKAKGSILELYQTITNSCSLHPEWKISWEKYAKTLSSNYLDKDPLVQQTLWKHCNRQFIESCLRLEDLEEKEKYSLFTKYLPKPDEKFISALKVGGLAMYKQLPSYLRIFPFTVIEGDSHKSIINKLNFIRKLLTILLQLEDQNEARIEAYYSISLLFLERLRINPNAEEKKQQQVNTLIVKIHREIVENLQLHYYEHPPTSRNSFSYYIPLHFSKLLTEHQIDYNFIFNDKHVFALYFHLQSNSQYCQQIRRKIFLQCKSSALVLNYLEHFPSEKVEVDMSENNPQLEIASKTFLLSTLSQTKDVWFSEQWDIKKQIIVYDPRITKLDLEAAEEQGKVNYFRPSQKNLPKIYDQPDFDEVRLNFFVSCLRNTDCTEIIPLLIPYIKDKIISRRREECMQKILQVYCESASLLEGKKWMVGAHEVMKIRLASDIIVEILSNHECHHKEMLECFLRTCSLFCLYIHNYKMEDEAEEMLKLYSRLGFIEALRESVLKAVITTISEGYFLFSKSTAKIESNEDRIRKNRLNRYLQFMRKILYHCCQKLNTQQTISLFTDVISPSTWKEAINRPDMWLLGECLLNTISNRKKFNNHFISNYKQFGYLLTLIMCSQIVLPLQRQPEAKKLWIEWQVQLIHQILSLSASDHLSIMKQAISHALQDPTVTLVYGTKHLLKQLMKNYSAYGNQVLNLYAEECLRVPLAQLQHQQMEDKIRSTLLVNSLCVELPLLDIKQIDPLYKDISEKLQPSTIDFLIYGSVRGAMWEVGVGNNQLEEQFVGKLIQTYRWAEKGLEDYQNFATYTILMIVNNMNLQLEHAGKIVEELLWTVPKEGSFLSGIVEANRMKLISKSFLSLEDPMKKKLVQEIPVEALKQINLYRDTLDQIQIEDEGLVTHENIITMFVEFAEVLMKIASGLSEQIHPQEEVMLGLLQCPFPGIKRTAFLLLKQMYELTLVPRVIPESFSKELSMEDISGMEIEWVVSEVTSYLYSWQTILHRRMVEKSAKNDDEYNFTLQDYLQKELLYEKFLKNTFQILENQLEFVKREQEYELTAEELVTTDTVIVGEDELNIPHKMYRLTLRTLFLFVRNFPLFLRDFMDHNKKYKNTCDRLLRNILSDAIFKEEILKIEMQEHEWKSMGNFEIYVTPKNKEIYAEYTHDTIRIGLRLVMRSNYPLTPIVIEFGDGLKMEDGSRWALMLQSQLHSRNNTIINGILLWKENIDKKLSGVEQCAICFDIVNNSGQLPKKSCKTCHKRFHGNCIMKWFNKSNKSECPLCKSQFL